MLPTDLPKSRAHTFADQTCIPTLTRVCECITAISWPHRTWFESRRWWELSAGLFVLRRVSLSTNYCVLRLGLQSRKIRLRNLRILWVEWRWVALCWRCFGCDDWFSGFFRGHVSSNLYGSSVCRRWRSLFFRRWAVFVGLTAHALMTTGGSKLILGRGLWAAPTRPPIYFWTRSR